MKKFIIALLLLLPLTLISAQDKAIITATEIAAVHSNTVVTGIVVVEDGKLPSSAIINDKIVWEGQVVTVSDNGRVLIVPRSKKEHKSNAPSLRLVQVKNGMVVLEYTRDGLKPHTYKKPLKSNVPDLNGVNISDSGK